MSLLPTGLSSDDDPRIEQLAEDLAGHMPEGATWTIVKRSGSATLHRDAHLHQDLRRDHPELYGFLRSVNQQMNDTLGCGAYLAALLVAAGLCVLLLMLYPGFANWWTYALICVVIAALTNMLDDAFESKVYARTRRQIHDRLHDVGLNRDLLVGLAPADDDQDLDRLLAHLQRDPDPDRR